jgi:gamma-glutamyltranspeptidase/glutathione hydrolase
VIVAPHVHRYWAEYRMPGVPEGIAAPDQMMRLSATSESARIFLHPEGRFYEVGERLVLTDYARTLERLAEAGWEDFHTGHLADRISADLARNGSYVTREDLASCRPELSEPLTSSYRGFTVRSNPPPGSGATVIGALNILEHFDLAGMRHSSAEHLGLLASAMAAAHHDRNRHLGDPKFADVPVGMLISAERGAYWADRIRRGAVPAEERAPQHSETTTLCTFDANGNAAVLTQTLGTGSGVVTPGLGFAYNNSMKLFDPIPGRDNSMAPGKARTTGISPTMLVRDGRPVLIVGAPGGSVIISATIQAISNVVDFGMSPVEAVTVPRIHCEGRQITAEATVPIAVVQALRALGHAVLHSVSSFDMTMSRAHLITDFGTLRAGADPRGGAGVAYG